MESTAICIGGSGHQVSQDLVNRDGGAFNPVRACAGNVFRGNVTFLNTEGANSYHRPGLFNDTALRDRLDEFADRRLKLVLSRHFEGSRGIVPPLSRLALVRWDQGYEI